MNRILSCLLIFGLLSACTGPTDNQRLPVPYAQPVSIALNTDDSYLVNPVTGDSIAPILTSNGDTLVTGKPIPVQVRVIDAENLESPIVKKLSKSTKTSLAFPNVHPLSTEQKTIVVQSDSVMVVEVGAGNEEENYLISEIGDTIWTRVPKPIAGKIVPVKHPKPIRALPLGAKDAANIQLQYLDVDQGLGSSYVRITYQDRQGNLWFGTDGGGLIRYDGASFVQYTEREGLSGKAIWAITEDQQGRLWIGTFEGGVNCFDGKTFTQYTVREGLSSNTVWSILEDRQGNMWFGTFGGGACRFDGETVTHYSGKDGLGNNVVLPLLEDRDGNIWMGTHGGGVSRFDGTTFTRYTEKNGLSENSVLSICEDREGDLWFGTTGGGASRFDGESFTHYTTKDGLNDNTIWSIAEGTDGSMWFGTDQNGVSRFDGRTFTHYTESEGLTNKTVNGIIEDDAGNLWFSTFGGGVCRLDPRSFQHFTAQPGLPIASVRGIAQLQDGQLWFGAYGGGISSYDGKIFTAYQQEEGLSRNYVRSVLAGQDGSIWIGTYGRGVDHYDGKTLTTYDEAHGLSNGVVLCMEQGKNGDLWFGSASNGVTHFRAGTFAHLTEAEGLGNSSIQALMEDSQERLWIATAGAGVGCYNGETLIHYTEQEGLCDNLVNDVMEDDQGNIWLATSGGLSRFDGETFTHYTKESGLSHNTVWSVVQDSDRNIWAGTEKGLNKLVLGDSTLLQAARIHQFSKDDGLKGSDFFRTSVLIDQDNQVWWGSGKSLMKLDLNTHQLTEAPPKVYLRAVSVEDQFVDYLNPPKDLQADLKFERVQAFENIPIQLELPHFRDHLTFHFNAIDWAAPHKLTYSYRMKGLTDSWSLPSAEDKAVYRNLPYGVYQFEVRALGEGGVWSEVLSYTFTINHPWWHTWWARLGYVLIGVLCVLGYSRWRTRQLKVRQKELETEVEQATHEIRRQKEQVEEAHQEITDSITYAKRIQQAILPPERLINELLPNAFILYKPKDIVAGDFYWLERKEDTVFFAVADCTGHGVPGAMVSVICNGGLNRAVREFGLRKPGEILDKARELVIREFEKSEDEVLDGMDIALCAMNGNTLTYAGANNPLWIVRNGALLQTKADRQPIGQFESPKPYQTHTIELQPGDTIYIFSDGFAHQFGGEKGKKFKTSNFQKLLLSINAESMPKQETLLDEAFEQWKGQLEQLDDVCVMGVRIDASKQT